MSFNISTRLNNLSLQVQQLTASSVTNPLTSNLNCASYNIINCDNITAPSGMPMTLDAGNSNVVVSSNLQLNNTLNVVNSTANNSLVVADSSGGDTTSFVVDASGNVGVKVNPATALTSDFTVNGGVSVSGDISCNNINASNVVNSVSVGSVGLSNTGTAKNPIINNTGVTSAVAGTGIGVSSGTGAVTISNSGVTSLTAGTNITLSGSTGAVTINATSGPSTWVGTATSALNMSNFQIDNVGSPNSALDAPNMNSVQSTVNRFSAGTNLWFIGANASFPINNVFSNAPNSLFVYGPIYNGTAYQGGTSNILPPSKFTVNFRCPVSTPSTSFSPGTSWPTNTPYYIRCELLSYNFGTATILNWLDTQTVTGWVVNTGPSGSPANVPYLSFSVTLSSNQTCPIDIFANGRAIALNISLANPSAGANYSFNPGGSNAGTGSLPYQDCAGIEVMVTTLANTSGQGF
jgi:hypothetical protein